ncbi:hypothetical protein H9L01_04095 [Erysipelothrix inopinata]|uniref:Uncharacterized protein n=1 Tax=Erysipelothrix inopinata TaxID=225084 RepID=A0A7G9S119_9FIRM|nr:hypothetical protein [Erysipelothrix inopinata]QNN61544.1 hypothetical protein H9L01_04095 [Erysipelothrix inopinata]
MGFIVYIVILLLFMLMISFVGNGFVNIFLLITKNNEGVGKLMNKLNFLYKSKWKYLVMFILLVLTGMGVNQAMIYYLTSGAYFWFVIFTMGLLLLMYIAPVGSIFMPLVKKQFSNWNKFSMFYWNFVSATSWFWGLLLIIDKSVIIYEDEGGVNFHYGSLPLKTFGGICLIIVALYMTLSIASKKMNKLPRVDSDI